MIRARYKHTATLLNDGQVLITGGCLPGANILNSAELYDPPSQSFLPTGTMVAQRCGHSATLLQDGTVLLTGGWRRREWSPFHCGNLQSYHWNF